MKLNKPHHYVGHSPLPYKIRRTKLLPNIKVVCFFFFLLLWRHPDSSSVSGGPTTEAPGLIHNLSLLTQLEPFSQTESWRTGGAAAGHCSWENLASRRLWCPRVHQFPPIPKLILYPPVDLEASRWPSSSPLSLSSPEGTSAACSPGSWLIEWISTGMPLLALRACDPPRLCRVTVQKPSLPSCFYRVAVRVQKWWEEGRLPEGLAIQRADYPNWAFSCLPSPGCR